MPANKTEKIIKLVEIMTPQQIEQVAPQQFIDFIQIIGHENAVKICMEYPGMQLKVPVGKKWANTAHKIASFIGEGSAKVFMHHYGGEQITIPALSSLPISLRNSRIIHERDKGKTAQNLAGEFNLTTRQINNICSTVPVFTPEQLEQLESLEN